MESSNEGASVEPAKEIPARRSPRKTARSPRVKKSWTFTSPVLKESGRNPYVSDERYADWVSEISEVREELELSEDEPLWSPDRKRKRSTEQFNNLSSPTATSPTPRSLKSPRSHLNTSAGSSTRAPYLLDFGKHRYKTLDETPSSYIDWLIENNVHLGRMDLFAALKSKGLLDTPKGTATTNVTDYKPALATWKMPRPSERYKDGFYNSATKEARWVAPGDAKIYFGVDANLLRIAKIERLAGEPPRYPLYQVYSCAEHFKTVTNGTTQQALSEFRQKNERRERESASHPFCDCCDW